MIRRKRVLRRKMFDMLKEAIRHNSAFWVCLIVSICLLVASFICPPPGEIAHSVLIGVSELFAFSALGAVYKALDQGTKATIKKGDVELTVGDNKEEEA